MLSHAATCGKRMALHRGGSANQGRLLFNINVEMKLTDKWCKSSEQYRHHKVENHLLCILSELARPDCTAFTWNISGMTDVSRSSRDSRAITRKPLTAETIRHRLSRAMHANDVHLRFSRNIARDFTRLRKTHGNVYDR